VTRDNALSSEDHGRRSSSTFAILAAWAVLGLSAFVMLGWLVRVPWMVQIVPGTTAMVFSTALCFLLLAAALLLTGRARPWCKPVQIVIGLVVLLVSVSTLAQYYFDSAPSLNLAGLHAWLNGNPGRMAPNTALAHAVAGFTVLLVVTARPGMRALAALVGAFAVSMFGVTGLIGYRLRPELMYGWHVETRMALHSGVAFALLGSGYAVAVYRAQQLSHLFRRREDLRVGLLGAGLMVLIGLLGGLVPFSLMQEQLVNALQNGLKLSFQSRHDLIVSEIQSSLQATRDFAHRPGIERELDRLRTDPNNRAARQYIETALQRHVADGPTGARLVDDRERPVASVGSMLGGSLELPLRVPGTAALLWDGEAAGLRVAQDIRLRGRRLGRVESTTRCRASRACARSRSGSAPAATWCCAYARRRPSAVCRPR
jgi:uncharacterized membrane protein